LKIRLEYGRGTVMKDEKEKIRIHKLILEIEKKKKLISTKAIKNYIEMKKSEGKTLDFFEDVKKRVDEKVYEQDNDKDKMINLRIQNTLLDEILSAESKMRIGSFVLGGVGLLLVIGIFSWMSSPSEKKDVSSTERTSSYSSSSKKKLADDCKWCNILRYAILKNDNNKAVRCRQNYINSDYYILCTYTAGGYSKRALFKEGLNKAYAINGTARAREFIRYSDIEPYDIAKNGSVDISAILSEF